MATDLEQRARELLAAEFREQIDDMHAEAILRGDYDGGPALRAIAAALQQAQQAQQPAENVVDHMVNRFLCWKLPQDFAPDAGISFAPLTDPAWTHDIWPIGTNLLHAGQAKAMVEHMLTGINVQQPGAQAVAEIDDELHLEWLDDALYLPPGTKLYTAPLPEVSESEWRNAFVAGAKWWEYEKSGATMWQSDQQRAYDAAGGKFARLAAKGGV